MTKTVIMNRNLIKLTLAALLAVMGATPTMAQSKVIAFPGAEGFGRYATGGRGGKVYHVTNLNDSGTGSLRWALSQSGKKIVVFDISGTIHLKSALNIPSNTTIAGQSAPGDGICVADFPCSIKGDNIIVRYMRFRLGNKSITEAAAASGAYDGWDGFGALDHNNLIVDHCSVSWSVDECLSMSGCKDITVQWCLVGQSMVKGHSKLSHGYGGNWGGAGSSYHHNLLAHHNSRTPRLGPRPTTQLDERMDMRNNVIYNFGGNGCYGGEAMKVNIVNNYYKPGAATKAKNYEYRIAGVGIRTTEYITNYPAYTDAWHIWGKFYVNGNVNTKHPELSASDANQWNMGMYEQIDASANDGTFTSVTKDTIKITEPINYVAVTTHSAEQAYEKVLQYAGASLHRDAFDEQMVSDTRDGKTTATGSGNSGGIINTQDDNKDLIAKFGSAWPTLNSTTAPTDTDGDGMPDTWETTHGLNPNDASDGAKQASGTWYTNVEVYLNSLVEEITNAQNEGGVMMGETLPGESVPVVYTISDQTYQDGGSNWTFGEVSMNKGYGTPGNYRFNTILVNQNTQYTITIPDGVSITSVTVSGYSNNETSTTYLRELGGKDVSSGGYNFPKRADYKVNTYTITLASAAKGSLTFTCGGSARTCLKLQLNGIKEGSGIQYDPSTDPTSDPVDPTPSDDGQNWYSIENNDQHVGPGMSITSVPFITATFDNGNWEVGGSLSAATTVGEVALTGKYATNSTDNGLIVTFTPTRSGQLTIFFGGAVASNKALEMMEGENKLTGTVLSTGQQVESNGPHDDIAAYDGVTYTLEAGKTYQFHARGTKWRFAGFQFVASTTGISEILSTARPDQRIYNLQGVAVDRPQHGIYIRNGKKVVIQ